MAGAARHCVHLAGTIPARLINPTPGANRSDPVDGVRFRPITMHLSTDANFGVGKILVLRTGLTARKVS
jgi:hypothetical protein